MCRLVWAFASRTYHIFGNLMLRLKYCSLPISKMASMAAILKFWERSGTVVVTQDRGAAGSSLTGVTVLCPWARHINPSLVLVQPRKTHPFITERLLMGRKESNKQNLKNDISLNHLSDWAETFWYAIWRFRFPNSSFWPRGHAQLSWARNLSCSQMLKSHKLLAF